MYFENHKQIKNFAVYIDHAYLIGGRYIVWGGVKQNSEVITFMF